MQICPLKKKKVADWQINSCFSRWARRNHDCESFKAHNKENEELQKIFGQILKLTFGTSIKFGRSDV